MRMIDLIEKKKAGKALSEEELRWLIAGVTDGSLPDYQLSAFLMAVIFRGNDPSGDRLDDRCHGKKRGSGGSFLY